MSLSPRLFSEYITIMLSLYREYKLSDNRKANVAVYILRETGKRRLIGGWCALVGNEHIHMCSAKCDKDSRVIAMNSSEMRELIVNNPDMRIKILEMLVLILRDRLESSYVSFEAI